MVEMYLEKSPRVITSRGSYGVLVIILIRVSMVKIFICSLVCTYGFGLCYIYVRFLLIKELKLVKVLRGN